MRIVVASTYVPFIHGGGTMIVESLASELRKHGHEVDIAWLAFSSSWRAIPAQTLGIRCLDLTESGGTPIDRLITIRYPSYALRHPNKVAWFIHHHRGAYDLWGTSYQDVPDTPEGRAFRDMMRESDTRYLREARYVYTNSQIVANRLRRFNGIAPDDVLYPPLPDSSLYRPGPYENFFLYASRLTTIKRQEIAVEAMSLTRSPFRLLLVGAPDAEWCRERLETLIEKFGLKDRVVLTGWLSEQEKASLTSRALAALYIPFEEDSYGYPTLEASHCAKAVLTFRDSGGTSEIVRNGLNGYILEPTPAALAQAMEELYARRSHAQEMGRAGLEVLRELHIDWQHVVTELTR